MRHRLASARGPVVRHPAVEASGPRRADRQATAVRFRSFDGTYTESLTLEEARQPGVLVALRMLGAPVTHDHGGPVRMYVSSNYGYKSTKWLSGIELTARPGTGLLGASRL